MNIARIYRGFLYLVIFIKFASSSNWTDRLVKYLDEDTQIRQVVLITSFDDNSKMPRVDELFMKLMERFPAMTLNMEKSNESENSLTNSIIESDDFLYDSTSTLFVIIEETHDTLSILPSKLTIDALYNKARKKSAKFLLVLLTPTPYDSLIDLLKYTWKRRLLDFTILELIEPKVTKGLLKVDYTPTDPIVHRYDPFSRKYTRTNWTMDVVLFPLKAKNMWGYPLNIGLHSELPDNYASFEPVRGKPMSMMDVDIYLLRTIAKKLNFTINWIKLPRNNGTSTIDMYTLMDSGKIDAYGHLTPHYSESLKYTMTRTAPIKLDRYCALVPILKSDESQFSSDFFKGYLMCFTLVLVFWALRYLMGFSPRIWEPFNIIRVLFGVSVTRQPTLNVERIMFLALLVVSSLYSANIYTALTHMVLATDSSKDIHTLEDLDRSGLTPMISTIFYNKTFDNAYGTLGNLKEKVYVGSISRTCPHMAATYKNVSCLMLESTIRDIMARDPKIRKKTTTVNECFWSDSITFLLANGSPYRNYFNDVITSLSNSGLLEDWYDHRNFRKVFNDDDDEDSALEPENKRNTNTLRHQLIVIAIVGYGISILAFIGEILIHRILKWKRSK